MNFDFGEVLARAWKITWKYKALWIFGILASCGRNGGNSRFNSRNSGQTGNFYSNAIIRDAVSFANHARLWIGSNTWVIYAFIGLVVVVLSIHLFITTVGQTGLIRGAYHGDQDVEKIRFGELFSESLGYFWRVIGLQFVVWTPLTLVLIGMGLAFIFSYRNQPYAAMQSPIVGALALSVLALCCCLLPILILLGLYYSQSLRALILEDLGVFAALARGWQVFSGNFIGLIVMGVVLVIINAIIGVIIAIPIYIAVLPLALKFMNGAVDTWRPVIVTAAVLCLYSPIAWLLHGIVATYVQSAWTLVYIRVTHLKKDEPVLIETNA